MTRESVHRRLQLTLSLLVLVGIEVYLSLLAVPAADGPAEGTDYVTVEGAPTRTSLGSLHYGCTA